MLVLSRSLLEKIVIEVPPSDKTRRIVVAVTDIDRGKVRIGIQAPRDMPVWREELLPSHQQHVLAERIAS